MLRTSAEFRIAIRSTVLRSSRTLPGHSYAEKTSNTPSSNRFGLKLFRQQKSASEYSASARTSSCRARSAGRGIGTTLSR